MLRRSRWRGFSKLTKQKQELLKIDLDQIMFPPEELTRKYRESNATELYTINVEQRPETQNERRLFNSANSSKKPLKHKVISIYRKQEGKRETCFFYEHLTAYDYFGNVLDHTRTCGRYESPTFRTQYGLNPAMFKGNDLTAGAPEAQAQPPEVQSTEMVYLWDWDQIRGQLISWEKEGVIDDKTNLYAYANNGRKYSMPYTWDQFISLDFDSLVLLGEHGRKYAGLFTVGEKPELVIEAIRQKVKQEMQLTTTTK